MADYSFPTIKTTDLPEVSTMGEVKEIIVNTSTEQNKVIPKAAFTLPQNQVTGLTDALADLDGATGQVQTNLEAEILERSTADNLKANISDMKKGYLFVGIATTSTVPPTYTANDRVYYLIDCPASATPLTLTNFAPPTGGVVIPILTVPTRYSLKWNGSAWIDTVDSSKTDYVTSLANLGKSIGSISALDSAPVEGVTRRYRFTDTNLCGWIPLVDGLTQLVSIGDEVVCTFTAPNTYAYTYFPITKDLATNAEITDIENKRGAFIRSIIFNYSASLIKNINGSLFIGDKLHVDISYTGVNYNNIQVQGYRNSAWESIVVIYSATPTIDVLVSKAYSKIRLYVSGTAGIGTMTVNYSVLAYDTIQSNDSINELFNRRSTLIRKFTFNYTAGYIQPINSKLFTGDMLHLATSYTGASFNIIQLQGYRNSAWDVILQISATTAVGDVTLVNNYDALRLYISGVGGVGVITVDYTLTTSSDATMIRNKDHSIAIYGEGLYKYNGFFVKAADGTLFDNATCCYTDFLEIDKKAGIYVKGLSGTNAALVVFYDINKIFISSISGTDKNGIEYYIDKSAIPVNTVYVRGTGSVGGQNYITAQTLTSIRNYVDTSLQQFGYKSTKVSGKYTFGSGLDFSKTTPAQIALLSETATVSEINAKYDALMTSYPEYISKIDCNAEILVDGVARPSYLTGLDSFMYRFRPTYAPVFVDHTGTQCYNELKVFITSGTHNEYVGIATLFNFMKWICDTWTTDQNAEELRYNVTFYIIPASNPWGIDNDDRRNYNLVDLNRNMPSLDWAYEGLGGQTYSGPTAGSEYESKILIKYMNQVKPDLFIDFHNFSTDLIGNNMYISSRSQLGLDLCNDIVSKITRLWKKGSAHYPQDTTTMLGWMRNPSEKGTKNNYADEQGVLSFTYETAGGSAWRDGTLMATRQFSSLDANFMTESLQGLAYTILKSLYEYSICTTGKTYTV